MALAVAPQLGDNAVRRAFQERGEEGVHGCPQEDCARASKTVRKSCGGQGPCALPVAKARVRHLYMPISERLHGAGDEIRTHDPYLGKVMLYP